MKIKQDDQERLVDQLPVKKTVVNNPDPVNEQRHGKKKSPENGMRCNDQYDGKPPEPIEPLEFLPVDGFG